MSVQSMVHLHVRVCLCVPLHMCKCFSQHSGMHIWLRVKLCVQACTHPSCLQTELVRTVHGQYQYLFGHSTVYSVYIQETAKDNGRVPLKEEI